jgi:hypothetical protein
MYTTYLLEKTAEQRLDETARHVRDAHRVEPRRRQRRTLRMPRVTWTRHAVRTADTQP